MALPHSGVVCLSSAGAKIHTCTTETSWSQASSSILCLCFKLFIKFTASITERMAFSIFWRSLWCSSCLFSKMKPKWFHCNIFQEVWRCLRSSFLPLQTEEAEVTRGDSRGKLNKRVGDPFHKALSMREDRGNSSPHVTGWILCSSPTRCSLNPLHFPTLVCGNGVVEGKLGPVKLEESGSRWLLPCIKGEIRGHMHAGWSMLEAEIEWGQRPQRTSQMCERVDPFQHCVLEYSSPRAERQKNLTDTWESWPFPTLCSGIFFS